MILYFCLIPSFLETIEAECDQYFTNLCPQWPAAASSRQSETISNSIPIYNPTQFQTNLVQKNFCQTYIYHILKLNMSASPLSDQHIILIFQHQSCPDQTI